MRWNVNAFQDSSRRARFKACFGLGNPVVIEVSEPTDEALLDELQRAAFGYFLEAVNPVNGLVADNSRENSPGQHRRRRLCAVELSGGGGTRLDRTRATRSNAASPRCASFATAIRAAGPSATGYKGFYYHFLDLAHRRPRLALGAVDDRHRAADRRRADRQQVL